MSRAHHPERVEGLPSGAIISRSGNAEHSDVRRSARLFPRPNGCLTSRRETNYSQDMRRENGSGRYEGVDPEQMKTPEQRNREGGKGGEAMLAPISDIGRYARKAREARQDILFEHSPEGVQERGAAKDVHEKIRQIVETMLQQHEGEFRNGKINVGVSGRAKMEFVESAVRGVPITLSRNFRGEGGRRLDDLDKVTVRLHIENVLITDLPFVNGYTGERIESYPATVDLDIKEDGTVVETVTPKLEDEEYERGKGTPLDASQGSAWAEFLGEGKGVTAKKS